MPRLHIARTCHRRGIRRTWSAARLDARSRFDPSDPVGVRACRGISWARGAFLRASDGVRRTSGRAAIGAAICRTASPGPCVRASVRATPSDRVPRCVRACQNSLPGSNRRPSAPKSDAHTVRLHRRWRSLMSASRHPRQGGSDWVGPVVRPSSASRARARHLACAAAEGPTGSDRASEVVAGTRFDPWSTARPTLGPWDCVRPLVDRPFLPDGVWEIARHA